MYRIRFKKNNVNSFVDSFYPVGSIYMSVNSTDPSTFFGGTWERIQGRFLLGANDSVTAYNAGKMGGTTTHTHTSAAHSHTLSDAGVAKVSLTSGYMSYASAYASYTTNWGGTFGYTGRSQSVGDGAGLTGRTDSTTPSNTGSTSTMPPFLAVYIWQRTQ